MPITGVIQSDAPISSRWATWIVYTTFLATGVGLVLPGAMLPLLLARWHLSDAQAGILFFLFFLGSASGAVLSRGSLPKSIARGCLLVVIGGVLLAVASRGAVFLAISVYGLGLGIVMTSISLLQSRRCESGRAAELARLNLVWAMGACLGPSLVLRGAAAWGATVVLLGVAAFFGLAAGLALFVVPHVDVATTTSPAPRSRKPMALLLILVPLATGVESATGGWLTTYSKRSGQTLGEVIGAVTCFWGGMLISRFIQSHRRVATASAFALFVSGPWLMSAALGILLISTGGAPMLAGALLLGLAVGPMYPLLLALALRHGEASNIVFVVAGCGASLLPLLTGMVSKWSGSLRIGLGVPLVAAVVMGCLSLAGWRRKDIIAPRVSAAAQPHV
jgi:FHS family glucose/mannose:H+ symporter-like MFS transporter